MSKFILPICLFLAACAHNNANEPSLEVPSPVVQTPPPVEDVGPFPDLPVRLYVPKGWAARPAEHPENGIVAFLQHAETGTIITVIVVPGDGNLDVAAVASAFWLSMLEDGFRPTHQPEYEGVDDVASVTFAGLTPEGVIEEGRIIARVSREQPDKLLLFVAEWPPGHLSEMINRVDAISINTRLR